MANSTRVKLNLSADTRDELEEVAESLGCTVTRLLDYLFWQVRVLRDGCQADLVFAIPYKYIQMAEMIAAYEESFDVQDAVIFALDESRERGRDVSRNDFRIVYGGDLEMIATEPLAAGLCAESREAWFSLRDAGITADAAVRAGLILSGHGLAAQARGESTLSLCSAPADIAAYILREAGTHPDRRTAAGEVVATAVESLFREYW